LVFPHRVNHPTDKCFKKGIGLSPEIIPGKIPFIKNFGGFHEHAAVIRGGFKGGSQLKTEGDKLRITAAGVKDINGLINLVGGHPGGIEPMLAGVLVAGLCAATALMSHVLRIEHQC
jgi:hypothetical protein